MSLKYRFCTRRRTAAEWTTLNEVLLMGEIGIETDLLPAAPKFKIGDGVTAWSGLSYFSAGGGAVWGIITGDITDQTDLVDYVTAALDNVCIDTGTGSHAIAVTHGDSIAVAHGAYATALGPGAYAEGAHTVSLGDTARSDGAADIALGWKAHASGGYATALGYAAIASGYGSLSIGETNRATAASAIAIGISNNAYGEASITIGVGCTADGYGAQTIQGYAHGDFSLTAGWASKVESAGLDGIAIGHDAHVETADGIALGPQSHVTATDAIAIGSASLGDQDHAVSIGHTGAERRLVHVASGVDPTDAVTKEQLDAATPAVGNGIRNDAGVLKLGAALVEDTTIDGGKKLLIENDMQVVPPGDRPFIVGTVPAENPNWVGIPGMLRAFNANGVFFQDAAANSFGLGPSYAALAARGSLESPEAVQVGDYLAQGFVGGHTGGDVNDYWQGLAWWVTVESAPVSHSVPVSFNLGLANGLGGYPVRVKFNYDGVLTYTGDVNVTGALSASNFSGSSSGPNTGDQDLSSYATKAYADSLVIGLVDDRGNFDASGNTFPTSGGSGTAGAILKGDLWTISVAGTLGGHAVTAGDLIRALVDTPGSTDSNWAITENNIGYVAENSANKVTLMSGASTNTQYPSAKATYDADAAVQSAAASDATTKANAAQAAAVQRSNHTGTQLASTISDFAATVRSTVLTGLSLATSQVIAATDTVLAALGYLQAQITALTTTVSGKLTANSPITGATKTKVTYDANGLVTSGADATTADIAASTNKNYVTDAQLTVIGNTSGTNSGNETVTTEGALIHGATSKATPVDADEIGVADSAASNVLKKLTWANLKATLKTYFDGLYPSGSGTCSGANTGDVAFGTTAGTACQGNDSRLSDARTPVGTALTSAYVWVGNGSNVAAAVLFSGDITITNAGVAAIGANKVTLAMQATLAANSIIGNNTSSSATPLALSVSQVANMLGLPFNSQSAAYTTTLTDANGCIFHPAADTSARTWTIDSNANVAYPIGTTLTFDNDIGAGVITIAITSDTLVLVGPAGTTGSRTLAAGGRATAVKVTATRWRIGGIGLT